MFVTASQISWTNSLTFKFSSIERQTFKARLSVDNRGSMFYNRLRTIQRFRIDKFFLVLVINDIYFFWLSIFSTTKEILLDRHHFSSEFQRISAHHTYVRYLLLKILGQVCQLLRTLKHLYSHGSTEKKKMHSGFYRLIRIFAHFGSVHLRPGYRNNYGNPKKMIRVFGYHRRESLRNFTYFSRDLYPVYNFNRYTIFTFTYGT